MSKDTHLLAAALAQFARLASGVTTRWIDCQPEERQRIYFANHTSHLDALVVWSSLPGHVRRWVRPVAAADYWNKSWLRHYLACNVFHAALVERSENIETASGERVAHARMLIERLLEQMGDRYSLIIFPEGTRGSGENVAPFKSGMYHLCRERPHLELVPAYIENLNRVLPKGEVLLVPVLCSVTFGPPLQVRSGEGKNDFLARTREALCRLKPQ
ncbi:MAG TPA: lysophospholipid acyltransferase family protein [Terriglobales bacterium]|nr:lysophospholipid acyltransferase family protein [Terriglobales bacterium]